MLSLGFRDVKQELVLFCYDTETEDGPSLLADVETALFHDSFAITIFSCFILYLFYWVN